MNISSSSPSPILFDFEDEDPFSPQEPLYESCVKYVIEYPGEIDKRIKQLIREKMVTQFLETLFNQKEKLSIEDFSAILLKTLLECKEVFESVIKESPLLFGKYFDSLLIDHRQELVEFAKENLEEWEEAFFDVYATLRIEEGDPYPSSITSLAVRFAQQFLKTLVEEEEERWIQTCFYGYSPNSDREVVFFLLILNSSQREIIFEILDEWQLSDVFTYLKELANFEDKKEVRVLLKTIVERFYASGYSEDFQNEFNASSELAQCRLLRVLEWGAVKESFAFWMERDGGITKVVGWVNYLYEHYSLEKEHTQLAQTLFKSLSTVTIEDLASVLRDKKCQIGPFFLAGYPSLVEYFCYALPADLKYQLLVLSLFNRHCSRSLLLKLSESERQEKIYQTMEIDLGLPEVIANPVSLNYLVDNVFRQNADENTIEFYHRPLIQAIPPILIGFLALYPGGLELLIPFTHCLKDEQLKYLTAAISRDEEGAKILEKFVQKGRQEQIKILIETISLKLLKHYTEDKIQEMNKLYRSFIEKRQELNDAFCLIKEKSEISRFEYQRLEDLNTRLISIRRVACTGKLSHLHKIFNSEEMLSRMDVQKLKSFNKSVQFFTVCHNLIEGVLSYSADLSALQSCVKEDVNPMDVDLTSTLHEGFWVHLKQDQWEYLEIGPSCSLGINDPSGLVEFGICSDQDLAHLGISVKWDMTLSKCTELMKSYLVGGLINNTEKIEKLKVFLHQWQNFISIGSCHEKIQRNCLELIKIFNIRQNKEVENAINLYYSLFQLLISKELTILEQEILRRGIKELKAISIDDGIEEEENEMRLYDIKVDKVMNVVETYLPLCLFIIRERYPLARLQNYLLNPQLKEIWKTLHHQGCYMLDECFKKGVSEEWSQLMSVMENPYLVNHEKQKRKSNSASSPPTLYELVASDDEVWVVQ